MNWAIERKISAGAGLVLTLLLINALVSYGATRRLIDHEQQVTHTYETAAGFQMHLSKPIEAAELIVVIASLAGRLGKGMMG